MLDHLTTEFPNYEVTVHDNGAIAINSIESDPTELCVFTAEQWATINRLVELMKMEATQ